MTPARRRPATPAGKGPTRTAPDVPVVAEPTPAPAAPPGGTVPDELLGPDGEPMAQEPAPVDAGEHPPPRTRKGQGDRDNRAAAPSPGRARGSYPLPVWPD